MSIAPKEEDNSVIAAFLAERDLACPECGHNLRGATTWLCPECGTRIELELRSAATAKMTPAWLTGIVLFGAIGGVVAFFMVIVLLSLAYGELDLNRPHDLPPLFALLAAVVHVTVAMTGLLLYRGQFCLAPRRRQWLLALSALLVPLTALIAGIICAIVLGV